MENLMPSSLVVQSIVNRPLIFTKMSIPIVRVLGLCVILLHGEMTYGLTEFGEMSMFSAGCKLNEVNSPLLKLKRHLFCDYDSTVRPTTNHLLGINVTISLIPQLMDFDEWRSAMTLHSWMTMTWQDGHLSWSPEDFDGLKKIHVRSEELWNPDVSVYNSGDTSMDQSGIPSTNCVLSYTGMVVCVPAVKHVTICKTDFTLWPYDDHECSIKIGSWAHTGEEVNIRLDKKPVRMYSYVSNRAWMFKYINSTQLVRKFACCPNDTFPLITLKFALSRHSLAMHKVFITPAIVLTILTLTVMWLDSRSIERIAVASINFICHLLCIFDLHWQLPQNGRNAPNILIFYRDSLALTTFALILTVVLRKLQDMNINAPQWVSTTTSFVLSNKAGRFLVFTNEESKEATTGIINADEDNSDVSKSRRDLPWRQFAAIIEWISFFCVLFTYVIIFFTRVF